MKTEKTISAGMAFMQQAYDAIPRSLGDREAIAILDGAMQLAIKGRFAFKPVDAEQLDKLGFRRCVGVFDPLHAQFYHVACREGGTYARMWEAHNDMKAWIAAKACFAHYPHNHSPVFLDDNRVTANVNVLLPQGFSEGDTDLATYQGLQVWRVTDVKKDAINLCRYKPTENRHFGQFQHPGGAPTRRRVLTRDEWEKLQDELRVQAQQPLAA